MSQSITFTYVNYLDLEGDELDAAFEAECKRHGATEQTGVEVFVLPSVTGHTAYITTLTGGIEKTDEEEVEK